MAVKILEVNEDSSWYKVQWRTTYGWISAKYATASYTASAISIWFAPG